MTTWYDDCQDGYPWWRITGQAYREYFSIPPHGAIVDITEAIHEDIVILGSKEIARRFETTAHTVAYRAKKLGYRYRRDTGHWVAPKEAA